MEADFGRERFWCELSMQQQFRRSVGGLCVHEKYRRSVGIHEPYRWIVDGLCVRSTGGVEVVDSRAVQVECIHLSRVEGISWQCRSAGV